eukprot:NODE_585_length_2569_cov_42.022077_g500_i0.p1 GENE.NODE_585_length_2569_cov_42.022077_g500_i0~~NODE_585_length_2569_cov_42.022077_g500_i0.p1  ORF type:complete len:737 (-),score=94.16 NODE_585_length_2569_cov_42.022077_g500_i0:165-2375(-)
MSFEPIMSLFNSSKSYFKYTNKVLDIVRISQWRVNEVQCPNLKNFVGGSIDDSEWNPCYPDYTLKHQMMSDYGDNLTRCGEDFPEGAKGFSGFRAINMHSDLINAPGVDYGGRRWVKGMVGTYPLNRAHIFDLHVNPDQFMQAAWYNGTALSPFDKLKCMRDINWIDAQTRAVTLSFFLYNPFRDLFQYVVLLMEITVEGAINTRGYTFTSKWSRYQGWEAALHTFVMMFVIYYSSLIVYNILRSLRWRSFLIYWLKDLWTWLEIANMAIFWWVYYYRIYIWLLPNLDLKVGPNTHSSVKSYPKEHQQFWLNVLNFARLESFLVQYTSIRTVQSISGLLCYLRLFKYVGVSPHFNLLSSTIQLASGPLLTLVVYIMVLLIAFAVMGIMIFGGTLENYRNFPKTLNSLFLINLGYFDYNILDSVSESFTGGFFYCYVLVVWLVVLNVVIGIIADSFTKAKDQQEVTVRHFASYVAQRSLFTLILEKFYPDHKLVKRKKIKSALQWNRLIGYSVLSVARVIDHMIRSGIKEATKEQFANIWAEHCSHVGREKMSSKGEEIAEALWSLINSNRDGMRTTAAMYRRNIKQDMLMDVWDAIKHDREQESIINRHINIGDPAKVGSIKAAVEVMLNDNQKTREMLQSLMNQLNGISRSRTQSENDVVKEEGHSLWPPTPAVNAYQATALGLKNTDIEMSGADSRNYTSNSSLMEMFDDYCPSPIILSTPDYIDDNPPAPFIW